jgi:hypothetical protein
MDKNYIISLIYIIAFYENMYCLQIAHYGMKRKILSRKAKRERDAVELKKRNKCKHLQTNTMI